MVSDNSSVCIISDSACMPSTSMSKMTRNTYSSLNSSCLIDLSRRKLTGRLGTISCLVSRVYLVRCGQWTEILKGKSCAPNMNHGSFKNFEKGSERIREHEIHIDIHQAKSVYMNHFSENIQYQPLYVRWGW